ncbi:MAG TPA: ECF transporter S component [Candidatus Scatomorpha pullicola]|nr:ECF transporter S component [Candidatus Scatomorpha pullicola]
MDARTTPTAKKVDTKKLATLAMLSALAFAIMAVSKLLPSVEGFLDFDFKDVVICIAGFVYGPLSALAMIVVVCILEMLSPFSSSGIIGCIMNIVATASFCCPACYIYKHNHTMKGAVLGLVTGLVLLIITMLAWNYFLTPIYRGMPREAVADMLLPIFLPFNAVKGGLNMTATLLLYKPVVGALRSAKLIPESESHAAPVAGKKKTGITIVILFVFATFVLFALSLQGII